MSLCPQENVPEQKHAVGFSTDYDETCWKRYWGDWDIPKVREINISAF